ncbi:hypothetical protein F511_42443 [Dorcoceras hygrometricum]|uniref:Uncharacterized protein n=1 Tax=Dorcoceras hygrometricum TaxID=472368 RepID=A0A2Z7AGZ1_9LAMI|nr:hypothetical protein F511_42443 [Dorcoceras hygrometricum]
MSYVSPYSFFRKVPQKDESPSLAPGRFHKKMSHRASLQVKPYPQQMHTSRNCVSN